MQMSIFNEVDSTHPLERVGDWLLSPARLFFGRSYTVETDANQNLYLKSPEKFSTLAKVAAIVLLPLAILATIFGLAFKKLAHTIQPSLTEKYSLPALINARTEENFAGRLPPNPLSPNCVNSQVKSCWGALYNADPIAIPEGEGEPLARLKTILQTADRPFFKAANAKLVEERENYLHYEYTVVIPSGPLKGTYIDDLDIFYDREKNQFDIRSASRTGFRDAIHLSFSKPGANKNRIEAIRAAFTNSFT